MKFYQIWKTRSGLIGVNKLNLSDVVIIEFKIVLFYLILLAFFVLIAPTLLFSLDILWMVFQDSSEGYDGLGSKQRLIVLLLTILSS
jgi:hypothetical protein